ncbi:MAG: sodium ion-translocating decarboxylase subunit beta [Catonella sp.]|nr:sodium ion-translocating decarboxylase subunit beta [Catonella sp.]MDY6356914.1 sodium ion-translocating decarboxylase subunit beta [Catonella sp.]
MEQILSLYSNFGNITWKMAVMWAIGGLLIYLGIRRKMEPTLLIPMGFGAILVNLPLSGAITQGSEIGALDLLFDKGVANELMLLLLFIGIGAMCDFTPLLTNPRMMLFGAAAQFGIFFTISLATLLGFDLQDAASIGIIGAADGPTSIFVGNYYGTKYIGAIIVAAYSYMALVPIIQPPVIRALTTKKERMIHMPFNTNHVSKKAKIIFPIVVTAVAGIISPKSVVLIGFLMFGNLVKECGVLDSLSHTASDVLSNLVTLLLGMTVASQMKADAFLSVETLMIICLGLVAFIFDTAGGVIFAKIMNLFTPNNKINPMIGAAGISAFPMSARVVNQMAVKEDPTNIILMPAIGANVSGQIASVLAGGIILQLIAK